MFALTVSLTRKNVRTFKRDEDAAIFNPVSGKHVGNATSQVENLWDSRESCCTLFSCLKYAELMQARVASKSKRKERTPDFLRFSVGF